VLQKFAGNRRVDAANDIPFGGTQTHWSLDDSVAEQASRAGHSFALAQLWDAEQMAIVTRVIDRMLQQRELHPAHNPVQK
jgi:hypothetical protein